MNLVEQAERCRHQLAGGSGLYLEVGPSITALQKAAVLIETSLPKPVDEP